MLYTKRSQLIDDNSPAVVRNPRLKPGDVSRAEEKGGRCVYDKQAAFLSLLPPSFREYFRFEEMKSKSSTRTLDLVASSVIVAPCPHVKGHRSCAVQSFLCTL